MYKEERTKEKGEKEKEKEVHKDRLLSSHEPSCRKQTQDSAAPAADCKSVLRQLIDGQDSAARAVSVVLYRVRATPSCDSVLNFLPTALPSAMSLVLLLLSNNFPTG